MRASDSTVIRLPRSSAQPLERDVVEIEAAIDLVAMGAATAISLTGLRRAESLAGVGAAMAQRAGVAFRLDRDPTGGAGTVRVGPKL